eukprot:TRINITY_DN20376_c0_g1_i1.p1 TRINITY_DN20376_c0_g1~~TRINITY_DN20376_c0_g1_i1.p1  ORF type:complete len:442 (+),score=99.87 TRINITY_DN20376_c0_g1_i1:16-1341(+)
MGIQHKPWLPSVLTLAALLIFLQIRAVLFPLFDFEAQAAAIKAASKVTQAGALPKEAQWELFLQQREADCATPVSTDPLITDKLTVIIMTYDRIHMLPSRVRDILALDLVEMVFVVWNNPALEPISALIFGDDASRVTILPQQLNNLNNRFRPIPVRTEAVAFIDDDMKVTPLDIEFAFRTWQLFPEQIVGYTGRMDQPHYRKMDDPTYSIVLTNFMLLHSKYLREYTCDSPVVIMKRVFNEINCDDLAMNHLVSNISGLPPVLLRGNPGPALFTSIGGLTEVSTAATRRTHCTHDFTKIYGVPLHYTTGMATLHKNNREVSSILEWFFRPDLHQKSDSPTRFTLSDSENIKIGRFSSHATHRSETIYWSDEAAPNFALGMYYYANGVETSMAFCWALYPPPWCQAAVCAVIVLSLLAHALHVKRRCAARAESKAQDPCSA